MDQSTLFVTAAVSLALSAILLWIARQPGRRPDPLTNWALAMMSGAAGLLLAATPVPMFFSRDIARALMLTGIGVSWFAARGFAGLPARLPVTFAGAAAWLLILRIPAIGDSPDARMALSCTIGGAYTVAIFLAMRVVEPLRARRPMLLVVALHATLYVVRAVLAATGLDAGHATPLLTAMLLEAQVLPVAIAFLLLAMTNERAERRSATALAVAEGAAEARSRFLAQLAHEIRTPLNGVLGLAQHLRRDTTLRSQQQQQVETLEAAGRHLLAIVNDSLDLARIDAGHVELVFRPFSPAVAAEGCLSLVRAAAVDKRIALRLSVDPSTPATVSGDSTRLQQILLNVLWNALKFTPEGGRVALWVAMAGGLRFEVSDTGPGIPQASWERLFKDFSMLDPAFGGTGLGLAISARLATRMGGRLGYHPGPEGSGSLFRLDLPWHASAAPAEKEPDARPAAPPAANRDGGRDAPAGTPAPVIGLHLLVVDDVHANRFLLQAMLGSEGHTATEAASCAEALTYLGTERFDGVLLDLRMPGVDGLETARRIRALNNPAAAGVPLIAVSADNAPETEQACLAAGMMGLITKPIERAALLDALQRLARHRPRLVPSA